jgi:type III secretory pathway component EscR
MKEICAVNLLLYSQFGPTTKKANQSKDSIIYRHIGDQGMQMYKLIFDNNNKETVRAFFNDQLIRKLWPKIIDHLKEDQIFLPASNYEQQAKRDLTMQQVTYMML